LNISNISSTFDEENLKELVELVYVDDVDDLE